MKAIESLVVNDKPVLIFFNEGNRYFPGQGLGNKWLWRLTEHWSTSAIEWRGGFGSRAAVMADIEIKTAPLRLTAAQVALKIRNGSYSLVDGHPMVLHMCPLSGATVLTTFDLIEDAA